MPSFFYKAKDPSGKVVEGRLDAADSRSAAGKIRDMGCWPIDVRQEGYAPRVSAPSEPLFIPPFKFGASRRSLALFFRQLSTMLQAGMSVSEALDSLSHAKGIGKLSTFSRIAVGHVRSGGLFSDAVSARPDIFDPMHMSMIRAGEVGGMFDSMVTRLADYLDAEIETRRRFSQITFYPKILLFFVSLGFIFLPYIQGIVMGSTSVSSVVIRVAPTLVLIMVIYLVIRTLLGIRPIRAIWDGVKICIPVLGTASRKLSMSRFSTCMSVMYSAGMPLPQSVELSAGSMGNEVLRRAVLRAVPEIRAGGQITSAFHRVGGIPDLVMSMFATGERTGSLDMTLDKVAEYYDAEARVTMEKTAILLFVLLIIAAGVAVAFVVGGAWMGYAVKETTPQ